MKLHVVSGYAIRVAFSFFSQCCVTEESPSTTKKGASDLAIVLDVFEGKPELQILLFLVCYPCGAKNSEKEKYHLLKCLFL